MSTWLLAYILTALVLGWSIVELRGRPSYSCPTCGSKQADRHSDNCPWGDAGK